MSGIVNTVGSKSGAIGIIPGSCAFKASHGVDQGWQAHSENANILFNDVSHAASGNFDSDSCYNTSTSGTTPCSFVAPATGIYLFGMVMYTGQNDTSNGYNFVLNVSGTDYDIKGSGATTGMYSARAEADDAIMTYTSVIQMSSSDSIRIQSWSTSDLYSGHSHWWGVRLS
jgi:hypothetical protein